MQSFSLTAAALLLVTSVTSFSVITTTTTTTARSTRRPMVTRSEYLRPHFEVPSLLVDTTIDMDRVKLCAEEDGLCDLEEMSLMLQQLVDLDDECSSPRKQKNPECDLNAKAKRDMFMDELGFLMERAEHLNDHEQEEKRNQGMSDSLAYRLARFHEIAEFEEH